MFDPATMGELVTELRQRAAGDRGAERRVARLADELKRKPALENDAAFRSRVAEAVQGFERNGAAIPMTPELRASLAPEPQQQPRQAVPQQQTQTLAGAAAGSAIGAMAKLYESLRPPAPTTPAPWEQTPQPLGARLKAFEARMAETATANQVVTAQQAGERAVSALDGLSSLPAGVTLARVRDAAHGDPGGIQAVVEGMKPGGKFAELRTAFNAALADRSFGSAYDRATAEVAAYGQARLKVSEGEGLDAMDRVIGQGVQALPSRKDGKSVQDELAEQAAKLAELLKNAVLRVGAAISSSPKPAASPGLTMTP